MFLCRRLVALSPFANEMVNVRSAGLCNLSFVQPELVQAALFCRS